MHTWVIVSRLFLADAPRLFVAVLDAASLFAFHVGEYVLPWHGVSQVAAELGWPSLALPGGRDGPGCSDAAAVEHLVVGVEAAQRTALLTALDAAAELATAVASSTALPAQPMDVVKDGRSPSGTPSFWYAFTSQFSSTLGAAAAGAAPAAGTPSGALPPALLLGPRTESVGLSAPLHALRLAAAATRGGGAAGEDDSMDGSRGDGGAHRTAPRPAALPPAAVDSAAAAILPPRVLAEFQAQWNVRAVAPMEGGTGAVRRSAPRIRLLSFYTLPPPPPPAARVAAP